MSTNPGREAAAKHLAAAAAEPKHIYSSEAEMAHVNATLALVFEQRTANLIAYLDQITDILPGERLTPRGMADAVKLDEQIRARLGLANSEASR